MPRLTKAPCIGGSTNQRKSRRVGAVESRQQRRAGSGRVLALFSPVSGRREYLPAPGTAGEGGGATWVDTDDGHDLHGLLTRDLMRYVVGTPRFDDED